jgi:uncharacterized membrane protein YtjA (UPF0391 family)
MLLLVAFILLAAIGAGVLGFGIVHFVAAALCRILFFVFFAIYLILIIRHAPRAEISELRRPDSRSQQ